MNTTLTFSAITGLSSMILSWTYSIWRLKQKTKKIAVEKHLLMQSATLAHNEIHDLKKERDTLNLKILHHEKTHQHLCNSLMIAEEKLHNLEHWRNENEQLTKEKHAQIKINHAQTIEIHEMRIRLEETRLAAEERQRLLEHNENYLSAKFENLAHRILENQRHSLGEQNQQNLHSFITPLRKQLEGFRNQIQEGLSQEAREHHTLIHEIHNLQKLNSKMAQETINLTQALKGGNKIQGQWGELILEKVLESAGLRKGHEYLTQVSIPLETHGYSQPDIIVRLPQGKDVIIDSKMTLLAYEKYFNSTDNIQRSAALKEHITAIRGHLRQLHKKDYHKLPNMRSLDYILMFIPVESAFLLAIDQQPELINDAFKQNIMIVSPSTLLVALRTIKNLWHYENQNRYTQKIADHATRLYDKIRLFVDDMSHIGHSLNKAQYSYQQAMKKLSEGRGNLISQAEEFRKMGVQITRPINPQLAQSSTLQEHDITQNNTQPICNSHHSEHTSQYIESSIHPSTHEIHQ
ncbi:DNA recombination protein RmuC [Candidatus Erwinia haradaeae]|uniref:DNA recombination protein RmuC n=1 Tax=Candidatus Erwinia haradaeae TaxID=1922217 RepID=A0A451DAR3_9GAMM|nr:DNA recombination protein RmuC [Candidatus Erwinia haradaeae]VFP83345.1 DNA recombination protein RmuC [Candidatus Erwinia haradaeae]